MNENEKDDTSKHFIELSVITSFITLMSCFKMQIWMFKVCIFPSFSYFEKVKLSLSINMMQWKHVEYMELKLQTVLSTNITLVKWWTLKKEPSLMDC
jgi:hypothetical protein